jgi:mannose-1-phosphate guanylyltransferase
MTYMLEWLRRHGVDDVILACGFMPDRVRAVLGDGDDLGVRLRYLEEPQPLGTGGALKFAQDLLDERFFMLNGDVLSDMDLSAQVAQHERTGARGTLALVPVEDPSRYGLVRLGEGNAVREFVEKPGPEQIDTNLINAGAYVLEREILDRMPAAGTRVSIEREVFPTLVGNGLFGFPADGYWLDIGTPEGYLQATYDILERNVDTEVGRRLSESGLTLSDGNLDGRLVAPAIAGAGSTVARGAIVGGRAVLGSRVSIGAGSHIEGSVLLDDTEVGSHTTISDSIVASGVRIGDGCHIRGGVVIGAGARIGSENILAAGARIFPGVELPDGAIKF